MRTNLSTDVLAGRTGSPLPLGVTPCGTLRYPGYQTCPATGTNALVIPLSGYARLPLVSDRCSLQHTPHRDDVGRQAGPLSLARLVGELPHVCRQCRRLSSVFLL